MVCAGGLGKREKIDLLAQRIQRAHAYLAVIAEVEEQPDGFHPGYKKSERQLVSEDIVGACMSASKIARDGFETVDPGSINASTNS